MVGVSPLPADDPGRLYGSGFPTESAEGGVGPLDFSGSLEAGPLGPLPMVEPPTAEEPVPGVEELAGKLASVSFGDRAFLIASEAQAQTLAVAMIRRHHEIAGRPKRRRLIVCAGPAAAPVLAPGLQGDADIAIVCTDDVGALQAEVDPKTAGFLIAPVRAQAGLDVLPGSLLAGLRETTDEYGLVLAFDETVCGLGRSGMMWAHEWTGVTPDLMIVGHGLGGSAPLGAIVTTQKVARGAPASIPSPDAAALASGHRVMDTLLSEGFEERVQNRAWYLEDRLALLVYRHRNVFTGLCGIGLMQGLVCSKEAVPLAARLAERGLLVRPMGAVLGMFPPLTVEEDEIDRAVSLIEAVLEG